MNMTRGSPSVANSLISTKWLMLSIGAIEKDLDVAYTALPDPKLRWTRIVNIFNSCTLVTKFWFRVHLVIWV